MRVSQQLGVSVEEKNSRGRGGPKVKEVGLGCGEGVLTGHNARLFILSLIFLKLNIKEQEGRRSVRGQGVVLLLKIAHRYWRNHVDTDLEEAWCMNEERVQT